MGKTTKDGTETVELGQCRECGEGKARTVRLRDVRYWAAFDMRVGECCGCGSTLVAMDEERPGGTAA